MLLSSLSYHSRLFSSSTDFSRDLSNNELQELPAAVFRTLRRVTVLHMASNFIKELNENILRELREMEDVDFSRNKLIQLPRRLFAGNDQLLTPIGMGR